MDDKGLIFIPDISGFTRFVNETDIQHSRLIISELLNILVNCNEMGLEISEVEGDALGGGAHARGEKLRKIQWHPPIKRGAQPPGKEDGREKTDAVGVEAAEEKLTGGQ